MHPLFRRRLRPIATVILVFFSWFCIEPWHYAALAQTSSDNLAPTKSASERFEGSLRAAKKSLEDLDLGTSAGKDITLALKGLRGHRQRIEATDNEIRAGFAATEAKLKAAGLPTKIITRHQKAATDYGTNYKKFIENLDAIDQLEQERKGAESRRDRIEVKAKIKALKQRIKDAKRHLKENVKERPHTPLDPNKLPHRTPKVIERAPRLNKEEFTEFKKPVQLAFNGDPSTLLLVQANPDLPTPQDLAETIEVKFTQEIQNLAASLENNPVKIYNWVRQNIAFVPTHGSIQGGEGCRLSRECNAHDAASLLIALLRVSGIAARYAIGTVEIDPDRFRSAMGDFEDLQAAARLALSGGIPVSLVNAGNTTVAVRMEHVWVEAYVDYIPSRGAVHEEGDTWIPMDAVLKKTRFQPPVDIQTALGLDPQTVFDELLATGTISPDGNSITGIAEIDTTNRLSGIVAGIKTFLDVSIPDATVGEVLGAIEIKTSPLPVLSANLVEKILVVGGRFSELPSSSRHRVTLQVMDRLGVTEEIRLDRSTAELAGKRVTVNYIPATEADVATIESFGGLFETPPYLVSLRPVVYMDGEPVGAGSAVTTGTVQKVQVSFQEPSRGIDIVEHVITAGTYAALGLDLQRVSREALEARTAKLEANRNLLGVEDLDWDEIMGETLHLHAQTYFLQVEASNRITAHQLNVVAFKRPAEMLVTYAPSFSSLFGVARSIINKGMNVDVRRYIVSASSRTGDRNRVRGYVFTTGSFSSAAEHSVFQVLLRAQSVSAMKLIFEANKRGIPVFGINATNVDLILPQLTVSSAVVNDVRNAIAAGKQVLIPRDNIPFLAWNGVGYIALDPETGAAAYVISGGLAGGGTAEESEVLDLLDQINTTLSFGLSTFDIIADALRITSKGLRPIKILGNLLTVASAATTAFSVWEDTGSPLLTAGAAGIDAVLSVVAGGIIAAVAPPVAAGAVITVGTLVGAAAVVGVVTVGALLAEKAIFEFLGIPTGFLWPFRRWLYAAGPAPDLIGVG